MVAAADPKNGSYDSRIAMLPDQVDRWLFQIAPEDRELFLLLLSRYTYLTEAQCQLRYGKILSLLQCHLERMCCAWKDVLFVTIESSDAYKSGSDNVRADLHKRNLELLRKHQIVAAQSRLSKEQVDRYKVVVFLDDIVGSGLTLWKEIKQFYDRFFRLDGSDCHLFYACIVPRRKGIQHIEKNCRKNNIFIQGLFQQEWMEEPAFLIGSTEYLKIEKYEDMVGTYMLSPPQTYFMGFQKNRLLVSFHYNTPNNTLSTFWRVVPGKNSPLFYRDGDQYFDVDRPSQRPSIDDLKNKKDAFCNNAYEYGRVFWEENKT